MTELILPFKKWRTISIATMAVALMAILLSLAPVRSAAGECLSLFRVKQFAAVTIGPAELPQDLIPPRDPSAFGTFTYTEPSHQQVSSLEEARTSVGFAVRYPTYLPAQVTTPPTILAYGSASASYTFDLKKIRAYLDSMGIASLELPPELDGATVSATFPGAVILLFGKGEGAVFVGQGPSPAIQSPANLDVTGLRQQLLQFYATRAPQTAAQLMAIPDWENTLVVPVPQDSTSRQVAVDGVSGLLIEGKDGGTVLLWEKEGYLFSVAGRVPANDLVTTANSLK